ncbi:unnamed protein product, partial [Ixodes persulcatus]
LTLAACCAGNLPDSVKAQEYLMKLCSILEGNQRLRIHMNNILQGGASCVEAERSVKEVLKSLGYPVQTNSFYVIIKQMLERVAPVMVDHAGVKQILSYVRDSLLGQGDIDVQIGVTSSAVRGLQLLHVLSSAFPAAFVGEDVYNQLLSFLGSDDPVAAELTLQIFSFVGAEIDQRCPNVAQRLLPVVQNFVENGSVKQAKFAVACLNVIVSNKERVFGQVIDHLKQHFTLESQYFRTALVSMGHISLLCPDLFGGQIKSIVSKVVVKDLLMMDREEPRLSDTPWCEFEALPEETKVKVEGMKLMVRWLVGLKTASSSASSTLRLLVTVITHRGDLMEKEHVSSMEKAWLRYAAAACMLKICCCPTYADVLSHEQFQKLALVMQDECAEVREKFGCKLHKHLLAMRLPLQFMAMFALAGVEKKRPLRAQLKQWLQSCINKRRDFLKQHTISNRKLFTVHPDFVLPYTIHLLAHDPCLTKYDDVPALVQVKECLWFLMEPLITKNEGYSFSFFKRLIENIKQTRDNQCPEDKAAQLKLYAVCDLALGLVMTKTTSFLLKDFPQEPVLPSKWYTLQDKVQLPNLKTYLPPELAFTAPKNTGADAGAPGSARRGAKGGPAGRRGLLQRGGRARHEGVVLVDTSLEPSPEVGLQEETVEDEDEEEVVDDVVTLSPHDSLQSPESEPAKESTTPTPTVVSLRALRPTRRDRAAAEATTQEAATAHSQGGLEPPDKRPRLEEVAGAPQGPGAQLVCLDRQVDQEGASTAMVVEGSTSAEASQAAQPRRPL